MNRYRTIFAALALFALGAPVAHAKEVTLLNVSLSRAPGPAR